jgi:hypothetical protein
MYCSEYVKSKGVKSLAYMSEKSGVPDSTLKVWYKTKKFVFDAVLEKVERDEQGGYVC